VFALVGCNRCLAEFLVGAVQRSQFAGVSEVLLANRRHGGAVVSVCLAKGIQSLCIVGVVLLGCSRGLTESYRQWMQRTRPAAYRRLVKPVKFPAQSQEWKIVSLRECLTLDTMQNCETLDLTAAYWKTYVVTHP